MANITKTKALGMVRTARRKANLVMTQSQPYMPSIGNLATTIAGGATAGLVQSGATPIPAEIGGISTPLIIGGVLAGYALFAGNQKGANPIIAKTAMNLGGAMLAVYASDMVQDAMEKNQSQTQGV